VTRVTNRPLLAHVGCSKTGTSSFQVGLWRSVADAEAAGVGVPFVGRRAHRTRLLDPFGWRPAKGFVDPWDDAALERTTQRLRDAPGERVLITNEDLVELGPAQIERFVDLADTAGLDLHLIITVRDWAQQIPSEYQQFLRHGMSETYPDFVRQVRDRSGHWGEQFWRRQDLAGILTRWKAVEPERISVVVVPAYSADPDGLFRLMGEAIGLDHSLIQRPQHAANTSHGVVEAEVFRRINATLPAPFDDYSPAYKHLIRLPFSAGVLPTEASARIVLPDTELAWVDARAREVISEVRTSGCRVLGDMDGLLPSAARTARQVPVDEADIARVSVETLARFADLTRRLLAERDEPGEPGEPREPGEQAGEQAGAAAGARSRWRGMFRR
jgi:hypothetical protein